MRLVLTLLTSSLLLSTAWADPIVIPKKRSERPRLKSVYAATHELKELWQPDTKAMVFVFMGVDCPVAQLYLPRLESLYEKFYEQGIQFYGVYPNSRVDFLTLAHHAHDQKIPFPVLLDLEHRLAILLDAEVTPEVVVLDAKWEKRYQGAIDNQFKKRGRLRKATQHYLSDAIDQILAGESVKIDYMPPSGCPIEGLSRPDPQQDLEYHRDVAPILRKSCENCHRDGGVGPFELVTYEDAFYSAARIQETVLERRMPPWHGFLNPKYGELVNNKQLSEKEIQIIDDWVRTGAAEGDEKDAP
ncbi:MAG: redoxin domain-containing protein, partial [Planctomycetales bacterium]